VPSLTALRPKADFDEKKNVYAIQNKTEAQIETISIRKRRTILVAFSMIPIYNGK
jgi:hypothetical protein